MRLDRLQLFGFTRRGSHDQLAAIAVRNALVTTIAVKGMLAGNAHPRHQTVRPIIDAGVNDLAVARRGHGPDSLGRLQHDHLAAASCEPPRNGKADHPRTDDDALDLVHW